MTPSEIITADAKKRGINPATVLNAVNDMVKQKHAVLLQEGETLMVLKRLGHGAVESHLFTEDKPLSLARNLTKIIKKGKDGGIDRVYGKADNPQILELLKTIGLNVTKSDLPGYNWMAIL